MYKDPAKRLTIVMPVYNGEMYIEEALESLITLGANIIVSDDGSIDGTKNICSKYKDFIKYRFHENMGQINTLNMEWERAETEFLSYLNCDDLWVGDGKNYILDAIKFLDDNQDYVMTTPNENIIDADSKIIKKVFLPRDVNPYDALVRKLCNVGPAVIFRKSHLIKWDPKFRLFADVMFYAELSSKGKSKLFKNYFSSFRNHKGSFAFSSKGTEKWRGISGIVKKKFLQGVLEDKYRIDAVAWNIIIFAREHMLLGNYRRSAILSYRALKILGPRYKIKYEITLFIFKSFVRRLKIIFLNN